MSGAGEVVCEGWLRKSPPEKKLRHYVSTGNVLSRLHTRAHTHTYTRSDTHMLLSSGMKMICQDHYGGDHGHGWKRPSAATPSRPVE